MDLQLPDRYQLDPDPILGEGGMGRVLRARDVHLNLPVALKIVRPDLAADSRFRKLFDLEVRVSARFTHPNIVPLHDLGELPDGTPYLGLAFADAGSFASFREDHLSWDELLRLTLELLHALAHLHARDVLHRDLKPENVLLYTGSDRKRHVWLADLGLANAQKSLAQKRGRMEGTPGFMAPEQKLGLPRELGPWTDLYSLGVILWELITETLPFPDGMCALDQELPLLNPRHGLDVPEGFELILNNLLSAEPLSRYDCAADLATELAALGPPVPSRGVRVRVKEHLVGTVATAVPLPVAPSPSASRSTLGKEDAPPVADGGATMFYDPSEVAAAKSDAPEKIAPPYWNRPKPSPIPDSVPREVGLGATARASPRLFTVRELPVVARDRYRQMLWDHASAVARERRPRVVLVVGEAGSGKTCLVDSVCRRLQEGGWADSITLSFQVPPGKEDGYAGAARAILRPWTETRQSLCRRLRRVIGRSRGAMDGVVWEEAEVLAKWCGLLEEGEEPVPIGYGLREVYRTLESHAWRGLSCLVIDNAEWAVEEGDGLGIAEATLQTLDASVERPILVLATVRSEHLQADKALADRVAHLQALGAHRVDLPRLNRDETLDLLRESLQLAPSLESILVERCAGNPLFARQLLIEWTERGWLVDQGGLQFGLAAGVDIDTAMPRDAEALFLDRVQTLAERSGNERRFRDAVHLAALAGASLPRDLLSGLAGPDLVDFVRGCGLWVEKDDLARFDHPMLHQALHAEAQGRKDAAYLHRRLARAWLKLGEATGRDVSLECGRHSHAGADWALAVEKLLAAANTAFLRGRTSDLAEASRLAVDAAMRDEGLAHQRGWATLWRARSYEVYGKIEEAGQHYSAAFSMHEAAKDAKGIVESLIGMGSTELQFGELAEAEKLYGDAMKLARDAHDKALEARAIEGMAWVEQQKRNFEGADILFTRVLNRYGQLEDRHGTAGAALGQAFVARRRGLFEEAVELYTEAADVYQEVGDLLGVAKSLNGRAVVARQLGEMDIAAEMFREAMGIAEDLGANDLLKEARFGMGVLYRLQGDLKRAEEVFEDCARWADRQGVFEGSIFAHMSLSLVALARDDLLKMYEEANESVKYLDKVPGHWLWAPYRLLVATMLAMRKDEDQTYRWLWSANELGLGDTVDADTANNLARVFSVAMEAGWANVVRVSGKLLVGQYERLGKKEDARTVKRKMRDLLGAGSTSAREKEPREEG